MKISKISANILSIPNNPYQWNTSISNGIWNRDTVNTWLWSKDTSYITNDATEVGSRIYEWTLSWCVNLPRFKIRKIDFFFSQGAILTLTEIISSSSLVSIEYLTILSSGMIRAFSSSVPVVPATLCFVTCRRNCLVLSRWSGEPSDSYTTILVVEAL